MSYKVLPCLWREAKTVMLKLEMFKWASDVTAFVNKHNIHQGSIQALFYVETSNTYYLYYWG